MFTPNLKNDSFNKNEIFYKRTPKRINLWSLVVSVINIANKTNAKQTFLLNIRLLHFDNN